MKHSTYESLLMKTFLDPIAKIGFESASLSAKKVRTGFIKTLLLFVFSATGFSFSANAQSDKMRTEITKSVNKDGLKTLQKELQLKQNKEEAAVAQYLKKNPAVKRTFVKNGSVYYLQRIDANGNPVFINTKNRASGELIKANQLYSGGSIGADITGTGMVVGVWDGGQVRATHELLAGRVAMQAGQTLDGSASNYKGNNHQTHVTGTLVGKDIANQPSARGIAYNATAKNYDFANDLPEMTSFAGEGYLISNHSYGAANDNTVPVWRFGAYDSEAREWDNLTKNAPHYLPFVAGGNEQTSNGNSSKAGYDLMTGSSAAKNVVTVGAVNGDKTMSDYSNWGPTDDGRVKPDIVAKGTGINSSYFADKVTNLPSDNAYSGTENSDGTSYASPAAAGSALLLQQYHNSLYSSYLKASTLKALLLGTTDDLGQTGPDPKFGWGLLNIEKAALTIKNKSSFAKIEEITTNPTNNSTDELTRTVTASGCRPLVVSIGWTDDEGTEQTITDGVDANASRLVYEFDVMVRQVGPNTEFRPWKPTSLANRTADATTCTGWFDVNNNNFKQVLITNPVAGATYEILIRKKTSSPAAARLISLIITGIQVAPTGLAAQSLASGAKVSNLAATGTGIKWYDAAVGGTLLDPTAALVNGTVYYASQTVSGCESTLRLAVTATVANAAPPAPTGATTQSFCPGAKVADLVAVGSGIKWYDASSGGTLLDVNTVLANGTIYYASQTVSGNESTARLAVTVAIFPVGTAPVVSANADIVCTSTQVTLSTNCPAGATVRWSDASTQPTLVVSMGTPSKVAYTVQCVFAGGCQSIASASKIIVWRAFTLTPINIGQSQSATKITPNPTLADWSSQFITVDGGPVLDLSTEANPTLFYSENLNKIAPRYWTVHVEACALGTNGSLSFDMLTTPEAGEVRSYNSHENNSPYFMYANRDGFTELYAQNHPAFGFYQNNGNGVNLFDEGLPKGLYKLSVRYWDMKGYGSLYPATRKAQGNLLAYQEYWFRIQSQTGIGTGAAKVAAGLASALDLAPSGMTNRFAEVSPNPVSKTLRLNVTDAQGKPVNVSLVDASGRTLLQRSFVPETNQHQEEFEVSDKAAGMYFLRVNTNEKHTTLKVVKVQ